MAEYFDADEIVKGYDSKIAGRILSYLKPYKWLALIAVIALFLSTSGELLLPVLIQRVIDDAILSKYVSVNKTMLGSNSGLSEEDAEAFLSKVMEGKASVQLDDYVYIRLNALKKIAPELEEQFRNDRIIEAESWYVFPLRTEPEKQCIVEAYPDLFRKGEQHAAILLSDLYTLSISEIRILRSHDISYIISAVILFFTILAIVLGTTFAQTMISTLIGQRIMKDLRLQVFNKTSGQSTAFLSRHPVGRIVTRLTGDIETINEFFTSVLVAFLKDFSIMIGVLVVLFFLSSQLALVTLFTLPPVFIATAISRIKARDAFRRQRLSSSKVNAYLSERLYGVQIVQLFAQEARSSGEFDERNKEFLRASLAEMHVFAVFRPIIDFLSTFSVAVVIVAGSYFVLNISLSIGVLIAFINLVQMFYSPVQDIAEKYTILQSAMAGAERVFTLLDTDEAIPDTGRTSFSMPVRGHIQFDKVCFSYKQGEPVLKNLDFSVKPGEMLAIVGYTGAGKTTITNLIPRLWDIDSGDIRIDGISVHDIPLNELRKTALPVLQDVFLFSGTIADNIKMGLDISDTQVIDAAKAVHAHEFIMKMPEAYNTILSEGATNISSGQRQLISFARVIAHDPSIIILDEATSSIDTETEHLIQLGIQKILSGRTSIVIAHRLSTIKHADRILVLSDGRVLEQGRHQELMDKDGLYASLYRLQYKHSAV